MQALGSQEDVSNSAGECFFSIFNVALLVHRVLFVFLCLPLASILYKHLWGGDLGAGPSQGSWGDN